MIFRYVENKILINFFPMYKSRLFFQSIYKMRDIYKILLLQKFFLYFLYFYMFMTAYSYFLLFIDICYS